VADLSLLKSAMDGPIACAYTQLIAVLLLKEVCVKMNKKLLSLFMVAHSLNGRLIDLVSVDSNT
jgi:hypothetical protein